MAEQHILVADAMVDTIAAGDWSLDPMAARAYVRTLQTIDADQLRVWVFPGQLAVEASTRGFDRETHTTWIVVARKVDNPEPATVDPLVEFARELRDAAAVWSLPNADVVGIEADQLYDLPVLHESNLFLHVFGVRWRYEP